MQHRGSGIERFSVSDTAYSHGLLLTDLDACIIGVFA